MKTSILARTENGATVCADKHGRKFIIDTADEWVLKYPWLVSGDGYVRKARTKADGHALLHRCLLDQEEGLLCDHVNHVKSDCRRGNLRTCTASENNANRSNKKRNKATSPFKGVSQTGFKWRARLYWRGEKVIDQAFYTAELAAEAYDIAARETYGEFAVTNFK